MFGTWMFGRRRYKNGQLKCFRVRIWTPSSSDLSSVFAAAFSVVQVVVGFKLSKEAELDAESEVIVPQPRREENASRETSPDPGTFVEEHSTGGHPSVITTI
ncbi:hypothetical protein H4R20_000808 [Coemansia guatemalensis]|uniref:Uncharacterized protein n=1 Tax=Coemansia guatemalensis TaxID=2761395 RepID=A0A9W8LWL1_9FUNG|nr:hypothetical protein H4R20_000808 [Coemansia guatemalensis]